MPREGTSGPGSGAGKGQRPPWTRVVAEGPLRLHMLEFQADIGLLPGKSAEPKRKRAKARSIFDEKTATPKGLLDCFPEEVAAARRLGRPVNKCHALDLGAYRVYCLMYYTYDGLCAMLYVEQEGEFLAAWCEREMETVLKPHAVWINGNESSLLAFLRHAMLIAHGGKQTSIPPS